MNKNDFFKHGRKVEKMEQHTLKNVNNCSNTNIYSYLETSVSQIYNPYLNVVHFSTPEFIRNLWQLKTAVFLHWCLICAVPLTIFKIALFLRCFIYPFKTALYNLIFVSHKDVLFHYSDLQILRNLTCAREPLLKGKAQYN